MTDINSLSVPIYPGINDAPVPATANRAGNGSDLINRFNQLIAEIIPLSQRIASIPSEPAIDSFHPDSVTYYVDYSSTNAVEDGNFETPFKTISRALAFIKTKRIDYSLYLDVVSSSPINETLDFRGLKSNGIYAYEESNILFLEFRGLTFNFNKTNRLLFPENEDVLIVFGRAFQLNVVNISELPLRLFNTKVRFSGIAFIYNNVSYGSFLITSIKSKLQFKKCYLDAKVDQPKSLLQAYDSFISFEFGECIFNNFASFPLLALAGTSILYFNGSISGTITTLAYGYELAKIYKNGQSLSGALTVYNYSEIFE